jgi:FAD/FMN-containing dehydrogenase
MRLVAPRLMRAQVNMMALNSVTYDASAQTVTVGGGGTWGQVYSLLKPLGRIAVGPNYRTVCVSGCLLGGCHSPVSRQFGLGIDSVVSLRVALYNGGGVVLCAG